MNRIRSFTLLAALSLSACLPPLCADALPAWRVATIGGLRIYSDCTAEEFGRTLGHINRLFFTFEHLWPVPPDPLKTEALLIFVGSNQEFLALNPDLAGPKSSIWSRSVRGRLPIEMYNPGKPVVTHWKRTNPESGKAYAFSPIMYSYLQKSCVDRYLMRIGERTPAWLKYGLQKLLWGVCLLPNAVEIPALTTDPTLTESTRASAAALADNVRFRHFFPLPELFSMEKPEVEQFQGYYINANTLALYKGGDGRPWNEHPILRTIPLDGTQRPAWALAPFGSFVDEAYEFIHLCLLDEHGRYRPGLWRFGQAAANGPVDESDFAGDFGMDYAAMLLQLWRDTEPGRERFIRWEPGDRPPAVSIQPASSPEITTLLQTWRAAVDPQLPSGK